MVLNNNIVFILFPGSFSSKVRWEYAFEGKSVLRKINFLDELKKIGYVYSFNYPHFNLNYYAKSPNKKEAIMWEKIIKKYNFYTKDINFSIKDIDYANLCKKIYMKVKNKYGDNKKYIVMGASYGGPLALLFSKLYKDKCILCCCLDNAPYVKEFYQKHDEKENKDILDKYTNNQKLKNSLNIVKKTKNPELRNNEIGNLFKFIMYNSAQDRIKYYDSKLHVPTMFFKKNDLQKERNKYNNKEKKHFEKDKNLIAYIVKKDVPHSIWENQEFSNIIIKSIRKFLSNYFSK